MSRSLIIYSQPLLLITPLSAFWLRYIPDGRSHTFFYFLFLSPFFLCLLFALHHYQLIKWREEEGDLEKKKRFGTIAQH